MLALCRSWHTFAPAASAAERKTHGLPRFVGRTRVLAELTSAFRAAAQRGPQLVLVEGAPGTGKSALLSYFAEHLQLVDDPIVLSGRCYERERVPYKGLDAIVDALTRMLLRLPTEQVAQLLPRRIRCLARIFPVLLRVELFRKVAEHEREPLDPVELQRGAFAALREMFVRIADQRALVLLIDDLHWGDSDATRLLAEVLAPPNPPRMLVVATWRAGRGTRDSTMALLGDVSGLERRTIALEPLTAFEARELARQLTARSSAAELIALESGGLPFLLVELVRQYERESRFDRNVRLEDLLEQRLDELTEDERAALELIALAGRPLPEAVLERALERERATKALAGLRGGKLVSGSDAQGAVVIYHESVGQIVRAQLSEAQIKQRYMTLIAALLAADEPDPDALAPLFEAIGEVERAAQLTIEAADRAMQALAFERAAELYGKALELHGTRKLPSSLYLKAAQASANCGRGPEAAQLYLRAAQDAEPADVPTFERMAALQWARCGHVLDAVAILRRALHKVGIRWPRTVLGTLVALAWRRLWIRVRGLRYALQPGAADPALLDKLDALYPAYTAFGTFDYMRGAYFAARALPLALRAGEPTRLVTALSGEAVYRVVLDGQRAAPAVSRIQFDVRSIADGSGDAYSRGSIGLANCLVAYWDGRWEQVVEPALEAEQIFRNDVGNGYWEANLVRSVRYTVQKHAGQFREMERELTAAVLEARTKRDLYALLDLVRTVACMRLARDETDALPAAQAEVKRVRSEYPALSLSYLMMSLDVSAALYAGDPIEARAQVARHWRECRRIGLHRSPLVRLMMLGMRMDCAIAEAERAASARAAELRTLARRIEREPVAWAAALAADARATSSALEGDRAGARYELAWGCEHYRAHGMHATCAGAQLRVGRLLGQPEGDALAAEGSERLSAMSIANPVRFIRVLHSLF
jgi:hypothetical protein